MAAEDILYGNGSYSGMSNIGTFSDANSPGSDGTDLAMASGNDCTIDAEGDIILDANGADIRFKDNDTNQLSFSNSSGTWTILDTTSNADIIFKVNDGGSNTEVMRLDGSESSLHIKRVAGFTQIEETFSGDDLLASGSGTGGTHDTHIDFRIGNKIYLQMTASMDQINLIFPAVSGNFLLNTRSDGDWAIGDWKVWESDLTAATVTDVAWPGGTQPDNTDTGRDIFSFYWDADNQVCYGVASLAFAIPS